MCRIGKFLDAQARVDEAPWGSLPKNVTLSQGAENLQKEKFLKAREARESHDQERMHICLLPQDSLRRHRHLTTNSELSKSDFASNEPPDPHGRSADKIGGGLVSCKFSSKY